ncbi:hypothetical protein YC2023_001583 [Brassica napus]
MKLLNRWFHLLGDCFKPYKDFLNKQTLFSVPGFINPSGCSIRILSSRLPCRKAVLTSICSSSRFRFTTMLSMSLMETCFTTGEKISL